MWTERGVAPLRPALVLGQPSPLQAIAEAHGFMESNEQVGKIVVTLYSHRTCRPAARWAGIVRKLVSPSISLQFDEEILSLDLAARTDMDGLHS